MTAAWLQPALVAAAMVWLSLLLVPWRPWSVRERLIARPDQRAADLSELTVLIPARDEARHIAATVTAARAQGAGHRIVVIDDQSSDDTAELARAAGAEVLSGSAPPSGWTGKLWALEQSRQSVATPAILQLDADIELGPGVLPALLAKRREGHALVSLMALLPSGNLVQKLLLPAYVWFFMLLYPFRLANGPSPRFAAAAGGCLMVDTAVLAGIGGYGAIRGAVIDDCSLAAAIKRAGGRTWIGLSRETVSRRGCRTLAQVRDLVARTAYTQLRHSTAALVAVSLLMLWLFWLPPAALAMGGGTAVFATAAWLAPALAYVPLLRFYRLSPLWALALPLIAALYLWMSWVSAWRHWRGRGAQWKGRHYGVGVVDRSG